MTPVGAAGVRLSLGHVDLLISKLAATQDAIVTFAQLQALGLGRGAVAHRRTCGLPTPMHVGVDRWGPIENEPRTRIRAAVLACGVGALASHHAALAMHGIRPMPSATIDVTVVGRRVRARGIRAHGCRCSIPLINARSAASP